MIGIPSATLYEPARNRWIRYTLVGLIALMLAVVAALVIERSIVLPIRRLRATAQSLGGGDLSARAQPLGGGEIGDLGSAFNAMAIQIAEREARLTELDRLKSEFVSNVSHELKTPLTTIKLLAHLLRRGDVTEEDRLEHSETIAVECDRQIDFVGNLLDLSRIESGAYRLRTTRLEIRELIDSCVEVERHRAESFNLTLTSSLPLEMSAVSGDLEALRRVIRGLIDNAIKYTPEGGQITVSAQESAETIAISVTDTGKGIEQTDLPHVFEKFYRAGLESDNASSPGVGLGLYLAQHIVVQLNGEISVESAVGSGTTFTLRLPRWNDGVAADEPEEDMHVKALARG
jgi:signal transduction histidine kinase